MKRKIVHYLLAELNLQGFVPVAIDQQPWSINKLDNYGYAKRGEKTCKNLKATVPSMTFTLAVTPEEVIGLSFVVHGNIAIYVADFLRELMLKLRKVQRNR